MLNNDKHPITSVTVVGTGVFYDKALIASLVDVIENEAFDVIPPSSCYNSVSPLADHPSDTLVTPRLLITHDGRDKVSFGNIPENKVPAICELLKESFCNNPAYSDISLERSELSQNFDTESCGVRFEVKSKAMGESPKPEDFTFF